MSEIYPTLVNVLPSDTFEQWRIKTNSLMAHSNASAVNLGNINFLNTDAKSSAVDAINEVNTHADANSALIGDLANLNALIKEADIVTTINSHFDYQISNTASKIQIEADARTAEDLILTQSLSALSTRVGIDEAELATTQNGAGLAATGTYVTNAAANYISGSISLADADNDLDSKMKLLDDLTISHTASLGSLNTEISLKATKTDMGELDGLHTNIQNRTNIVGAINALYDMLYPIYAGTANKYVKIGGDTMTGSLTIQNGNLDVSGTTSSRIYCDGDIVAYRNS